VTVGTQERKLEISLAELILRAWSSERVKSEGLRGIIAADDLDFPGPPHPAQRRKLVRVK